MPTVKKFPTSSAGTTTGPTPGSYGTWLNPNRIFATDGSLATSSYWMTSDGSRSTDSGTLVGTAFGFSIPTGAIIDGIQVDIVAPSSTNVGDNYIVVGTASKNAAKHGTVAGTFGGGTDLWGRTDWTAADFNNAAFFASMDLQPSHSPSDASASVDSIAVTIYYHLAPVTVPTDVPTREVYKVYNSRGLYLGNLPTPTTPLKLPQDINSLGTQITVNVPVSIDTSMLSTSVYTLEDASANYTDEAGSSPYTTANQIPIASLAFQGIDTLIKNGNIVQVWLYNYWYPNGKCMYIGRTRRWAAGVGDDGNSNDSIDVVLYSTGYDMDNYITRGLPFVLTDDQTQLSQNASDTIINSDKGSGQAYGQSFKIGTALTIGGITVKLNGVADVTLGLYSAANGTRLATSTQHVDTAGAAADVVFYMPTPIDVTPGTTYFFAVSVAYGQSITIYYQNTDVYTNGTAYNLNQNVGWGVVIYGPITGDLYFKVSSGVPSTTATFTSKDPSIGMLQPIIDDYNKRGGSQVYTASTIDATGLSLTYTFKVQTIYEALQAILSLSPNGFYYYLDLGTQTIYFKNQSTSADYILTKGVEINNLKLISSIENSINDMLFTGGTPSGGTTNIYKEYQDTTSIGAFGPLLDRKTDSRVTLMPTADAIGVSEIAAKAGEQNQTTITLAHTKKLDITLLVPGKTIGFRGYGTFIDQLILQIVHREWTAESVVLTVGILPTRLTYEYENTTRQLIAAQTQANPTSPS